MSHFVPSLSPACGHPAPTKGHLHVGTDVTSLPSLSAKEPPARGAVATAASDSQSTWLGTPGWPGRWRCSCGSRPSASLVSSRGIPCPHPTLPSSTVALAGWCPLSPAGAQTTQMLVEPPWRPPVLWDQVTLTCQGSGTAGATTWYKNGQLWRQGRNDLTVTESGTYTCDRSGTGLSPAVIVSDDLLVLQVPSGALLEGDTVTLRCRGRWNSTVTMVRFYKDEKDLGGSLNGTELSLSPLQLNHSGHYSCRGLVGSFMSRSPPVTVTVHVPVANATITPSVLEVTPQDTGAHRDTVAIGLSGALLFLLLFVGVIVAWHQWHHVAASKHQERAPPDAPAPPEQGEVLYTHVMVTKRAGASPCATTLQDPQVTYAELRGPQGRPREPGDIYGNVL
ncbi:low affinity immunoglobulin gamma Fc region receptor II-like isoform X2 [Motacilla alba alba]|uniref:low affinity immunoglobulin gamma Fc region receptor II-like isoform X2 n=1 Tax=Motacilla alba alba TaxID=1094192 RepID=UPI0018D529B2|nr:low affinity immunoglobulin gamma Fc region receptor II-like isoform X2 [Motacilla alba alba]